MAVASIAIMLSGCHKSSASAGTSSSGAVSSATVNAQINPATAGTVSGTIHFSGKAPERLTIDMDQDPACQFGSAEPNKAEQFVVHDGGLKNVYVYVKAGLEGQRYAAPTAPVVLDQKGCRYTPHVVALMVGQPLEVRNSDSTMHNVHAENASSDGKTLDISQAPMGKPVTVTFDKAQIMLPVRCNNHPWMNAYANVAANPFFAVSDENGHFEIKGLPPGTYTVAAVHEKLGEQSAIVTVRTGNTSAQDFTYKAQ